MIRAIFLIIGVFIGFVGGILSDGFPLVDKLKSSLVKPSETLLRCESVGRDRPDFLRIIGLGSNKIEMYRKQGSGKFEQLEVTSASPDEIRWIDGWGYRLGGDVCPADKKFCATEKVMPTFKLPDVTGEYYLVEQIAAYDCCRSKYRGAGYIAEMIPQGTDLDRQLFCYDVTSR